MYQSQISTNYTKEVNDYYVRRGGLRTANIGGGIRMDSFSGLMQKAAAAQRASAAAQAESAAQTNSTGKGEPATETASRSSESGSSQSEAAGGSNICCEKCHATNQLMLQMMSRNLYSQSALGYPLTGYGSWNAYQNMANMLGKTLF